MEKAEGGRFLREVWAFDMINICDGWAVQETSIKQ